ncbi:MAG: nucleotidyltransferase domain-containing protein [Archangiaceae bacterium]|nr:nucleotidyltransferase domain-containing protein [Archangiaceae bacterium]
MSPSPRLEAAIAGARARLQELGLRSVAVVGSVARGDAIEGSDVDLWALGPRDEVLQWTVEGVPVTVMVETLERCQALEHLGNVEVGHARVLSDPHGHFAALAKRFAQARPALYRGICDVTVSEVLMHLQRAGSGDPEHRLLSLRAAVYGALCLEVFCRTGVRDPRYRHVKAVLGPADLELADAMLGWRLSAERHLALVALLQLTPAALETFLAARVGSLDGLPRVDALLAELEGSGSEGVQKVCLQLGRLADLVEPGHASRTEPWALLRDVFPAAVVAAYRTAHGLVTPGAVEGQLHQLQADAARWLDRPETRQLLDVRRYVVGDPPLLQALLTA